MSRNVPVVPASADLVWLLTRSSNSFLVKRNGVKFTREAGNLTNVHGQKISGLAAEKTIDIAAAANGAVTLAVRHSTPSAKDAKNAVFATTIRGPVRRAAKKVANIVHTHRPDLLASALARTTRFIESQKTPKALRPAKIRGAKKAVEASA